MDKVTAIIVNYNGAAYIRRCVECLSIQTYGQFRAIVVDNASTDNSLDVLRGLDERFRVVSLKRNTGFAAANNTALEMVETPWVATLNPDAFPAVDWLEKFIEGEARHQGVSIFGCVQLQERDQSRLDGLGDVYSGLGIFWRGGYGSPLPSLESDKEIFSPCAAAAFYRASDLREVNGFDEDFFCYCEDVDLGFRLRLRGRKCILLRESVVTHLGSESVGRYGDFAIYHGFRNRIWTFIKNYPSPLFVFVFPVNLAITIALALEKIRIGKAKPAFSGIVDALRDIRRVWSQRRLIQKNRNISSIEVYKSMCWSMLKLVRRLPDTRGPK